MPISRDLSRQIVKPVRCCQDSRAPHSPYPRDATPVGARGTGREKSVRVRVREAGLGGSERECLRGASPVFRGVNARRARADRRVETHGESCTDFQRDQASGAAAKLARALVRKLGRPLGSENSRGGASVGNFTRISGRHNALKVKAQERFRDETSSVVVKGGLRAGSPRASKRCGRVLGGCGSLSNRVPFAMDALKSPKVHGGCCFRRSVPIWPFR